MILTYSRDEFVDLILRGFKIHTIRADKTNRWHPGYAIQHWRGNPRSVKARNSRLLMDNDGPFEFKKDECISVQRIEVINKKGHLFVMVEGRPLEKTEMVQLCENDGLMVDEFIEWFVPNHDDIFRGKIIHWTDFRY